MDDLYGLQKLSLEMLFFSSKLFDALFFFYSSLVYYFIIIFFPLRRNRILPVTPDGTENNNRQSLNSIVTKKTFTKIFSSPA